MTPWPPALSEAFRTRLLAQDDAACRPWLAALPALCVDVAAGWRLEPAGPPAFGGAGLVLPMTGHNDRLVALKLVSPLADADAEQRALAELGGRGAVSLLDADLERGALLLEHVPGPTLEVEAARLRPVEAAAIAGLVARRIAEVPAPADAPQLADGAAAWLTQLEAQHTTALRRGHALDEEAVAAARDGITRLGTCRSTSLTHGDLSFANIMRRADGTWIAIDPGFVAGPLENEAHTVLRSLLPSMTSAPDPSGAMAEVVRAYCSAAGGDPGLALDLSHARFVASYFWEAQHHGAPDDVENLRRAATTDGTGR